MNESINKSVNLITHQLKYSGAGWNLSKWIYSSFPVYLVRKKVVDTGRLFQVGFKALLLWFIVWWNPSASGSISVNWQSPPLWALLKIYSQFAVMQLTTSHIWGLYGFNFGLCGTAASWKHVFLMRLWATRFALTSYRTLMEWWFLGCDCWYRVRSWLKGLLRPHSRSSTPWTSGTLENLEPDLLLKYFSKPYCIGSLWTWEAFKWFWAFFVQRIFVVVVKGVFISSVSLIPLFRDLLRINGEVSTSWCFLLVRYQSWLPSNGFVLQQKDVSLCVRVCLCVCGCLCPS